MPTWLQNQKRVAVDAVDPEAQVQHGIIGAPILRTGLRGVAPRRRVAQMTRADDPTQALAAVESLADTNGRVHREVRADPAVPVIDADHRCSGNTADERHRP
ncbi:hypothetical protein FM119_06660 [Mycetocola reblochoni REB411]|uniref:Uncharacterized protein n=1 Tax=Mycetocola reblochoni REB411 TaxID=1255698 RepID=A0A1R4JC93_9MICO|nr:hypothetical protein [Mycetocola reblochoni]SJN29564.1 hypothetical protein FM119_06660 [Mycetocola reblochoni REB411]